MCQFALAYRLLLMGGFAGLCKTPRDCPQIISKGDVLALCYGV